MIEDMFKGLFGPVSNGMCRLSMNGGIAVKTSNGYKTYNVKKKTLTNVTSFCFDVGNEMFFVIPTNKVAIGDIILVGGKPKCVIEKTDECIKAIDYESSEIKQIVPERHVFMGSTYFYGKIVSMFGDSSFLSEKSSGNKIMKMLGMQMLMKAMSGNSNNTGMSGMAPFMMMGMMGGENPFGNMFSGFLDAFNLEDIDEDESDEDAKEEK